MNDGFDYGMDGLFKTMYWIAKCRRLDCESIRLIDDYLKYKIGFQVLLCLMKCLNV